VANEKATVRAIPVYMESFVVISLLNFIPALSLWLPGSMGVYQAVAAINRGVRESLRSSREYSVRLTLELGDHLFRTEDSAEGIRAFFEKREPRFEGAPETGAEVEVWGICSPRFAGHSRKGPDRRC